MITSLIQMLHLPNFRHMITSSILFKYGQKLGHQSLCLSSQFFWHHQKWYTLIKIYFKNSIKVRTRTNCALEWNFYTSLKTRLGKPNSCISLKLRTCKTGTLFLATIFEVILWVDFFLSVYFWSSHFSKRIIQIAFIWNRH